MDERPPADEESGGGADVAADEQTARAVEGTDGSPAPTAADDAAAIDAAAAALTSSTASDGDEPGQPDQLSPSSTGSGKRFSAPEPPKWRFVDQAKKSLGYSSYSAGTVVQGLSAEELVGKYEPKWKPSDSKPVEHVKEQVAEIDHDVEEAVEKDGGDVGRLTVQEGGDTVEETFEGTFAGFRKKGDEEGTPADDAQKSAPLVNDEIKRVVKEAVKEAMCELVVKNVEEGVMEAPDPAEPAIALGIATPAVGDKEGMKIEEPKDANGNEQPPEELEKTAEEDEQKKKKRRCLLLLLLLLIMAIIAIALGVALGGDEKEENSNRAIDGGSLVSEDDNATSSPTTTPSVSKSPSALPTPALPTPLGACPSNMKSFNVRNEGLQQEGQPLKSEKTWIVKDACSGEEELRCPPCSDGDSELRELRSSSPRQVGKESRQVCIGITDRPRPVRDGERFRFQLYVNSYGSGACIDGNGRKYQFGLINAAADFGECADKCVKDVPVGLAMSDSFQGYEFDCNTKECMCLYDAGTLNETHSESFDRVQNEEDYGGGTGKIGGVISLDDRYCGKLVQGRDGGIDYPTYAPKGDIPNPTNAPKDDTIEVENDITGSDGFNSCLPGGKEYIFEVVADDGGSCCGFAPEAFVAAYDDVVVMRGDWPEGKEEEIDGSSGTSNNLFEGPSLDDWTTKFGASSEPCPSAEPPPAPSYPPILPTNTPSASAPLPPFQDIVLPVDGGIYPCREVIEAEMAGRINNLTCTFCGHCQWKFSSFNCYQRVTFLVTRYGLGQLEARQNLCAQGRCLVPANGVGPGIQAAIERASYCGEPPVEVEVVTDTPTQPTTANPSSAEPTTTLTLNPTSWITARPIRSPTLQPASVEELATGTPAQPSAAIFSSESTESPTLNPTSSPTTARPTRSPTLQPTCDTSYEDFNLCFAIDMSGSVCNQGTGFECEGCLPNLICNEGGFDNSTCCTNFFSVTSFAKSLVDSLEPLPVEKGYSIVSFASGATVALSLGQSEDTLSALDDLVYTGGRTNHADAINACASSLRSSGGDGRNLILLITDGDPSEPQGSPLEDAELAADRAKSEGAFIIPLVVTQESSSLAANQEYLQGISSDGSVFKVSDFDGLDTIQEGLLAQVSCQV